MKQQQLKGNLEVREGKINGRRSVALAAAAMETLEMICELKYQSSRRLNDGERGAKKRAKRRNGNKSLGWVLVCSCSRGANSNLTTINHQHLCSPRVSSYSYSRSSKWHYRLSRGFWPILGKFSWRARQRRALKSIESLNTTKRNSKSRAIKRNYCFIFPFATLKINHLERAWRFPTERVAQLPLKREREREANSLRVASSLSAMRQTRNLGVVLTSLVTLFKGELRGRRD